MARCRGEHRGADAAVTGVVEVGVGGGWSGGGVGGFDPHLMSGGWGGGGGC
jgi:hypothetical protein